MDNTENSGRNGGRKSRIRKIAGWTILAIFAVWAVVLAVIQIALTPAVLTNVANSYASQLVDGNISFGKVRASVFRHFPYLNVTFDSLAVTYPSDRFEEYGAGKDWYTRQGRGETCDTLMSFGSLSASVNLASLVSGQINVPGIYLSRPRIFATAFNDSTATWNILRFLNGPEEDDDTVSTEIPDMVIGRIRFTDNPRIIFNSIPDSTNLALSLKRMIFSGRVVTRDLKESRLGLRIDTLFLSGRFPADTIALRLDNFSARGKKNGIEAKVLATTYLAMSSYGRMKLPVSIESEISFPEGSARHIAIDRFEAGLADIPLSARADIKFGKDSIYIKGHASIDDCEITRPIDYFGKNILKELGNIRTDAVISMSAEIDGWLDAEGHIPAVDARLEIPVSGISHKLTGDSKIGLKAMLKTRKDGRMDMQLDSVLFLGRGLAIAGSGAAADILGGDPQLSVDSYFFLNLDTLSSVLKKNAGYSAAGRLSAELEGNINMSQLSPYMFADADLKGSVRSRRMVLYSEADSIDIYIDSLDVKLGTFGNTYTENIEKGERMMAVAGYADSLRFRYKDMISMTGRELSIMAQNSAAVLDKSDSSAFYPFGGKFNAGFLSMVGADTSAIAIAKSDNRFTIMPKAGNPEIPVINLDSKTGGVFIKGPVNRLAVFNLDMSATAAMNSIERRKKARAFIDSLSRAYPDIPKDSLFRHIRKTRPERTLPDWLTEEDFRKNDLSFDLGENVKKYFRDWDFEGKMSFKRTTLMSPYFPLRNSISDFKGTFDNNEVSLENMSIKSGHSNLTAKGSLSGLKMAVLWNGPVTADINVSSDWLDVNELLAAYSAGSSFDAESFKEKDLSGIEDDEFEEMIVADSTELADTQVLIVIPANINAGISLDARNVRYSKLELERMTADILMKERCVQLTNTSASTNMGDMFFEGFYSTRTKKDLKTGFNLNFSRITAEKVIEMIPAVDSIMPMLKSFKGELNLEMAATADIDTAMNIRIPTINGVIRIGGNRLQLHNDESIRQIARILRFKDRENSYIDRMSVEGVISDSQLEIFPFVLDIDRYTLAMSGIQNLDSSFKYHISVIESPLIFKFGVDLWGDFDNMKFRIGKAKYKNVNVPVFTYAVDQAKLNLAESIRNIFQKGVDEAVKENERQSAINNYKEKIDYVEAVDEQLDSLDTAEQEALELNNTEETE